MKPEIAISLFLMFGCQAATTDSSTKKQLEFQPAKLVVNESGSISLTLKNTGTTPLNVISINTTCGCTLPDGFQGSSLTPGESQKINFDVSVPSYGTKKVNIIAITDTAEKLTALATLELKGPEPETPRILEKPLEVTVRGTEKGKQATSEFSLMTVEDSEKSWLQSISCSDADIQEEIIKIEEIDRPTATTIRKSYTIRVTAPTPVRPGGIHRSILQFRTTNNSEGFVKSNDGIVNLKVEYHPKVRALPDALVIESEISDSMSITLLFEDPDEWSVNVIEDIEFVALVPISKTSRLQTFRVTFSHADMKEVTDESEIKFQCSSKSETYELLVPVTFEKLR